MHNNKTSLDKLATELQIGIIQENHRINDRSMDKISAFRFAIDKINLIFHTRYSITKAIDYNVGDTIPTYKDLPLLDNLADDIISSSYFPDVSFH